VARDVRNSWLDMQKTYLRLDKLGLSSIVEFSQVELQTTDADLQNTDAKYLYGLTQIMLAYQMGERR